MNPILVLSLVIILGAALGPKGTYRRSHHHRLRDKQTPTFETNVFDHEALQRAAVKLKSLDTQPTTDAWQKAAVKVCDGNAETYPMQGDALIREFGERWIARAA
jgi:hypothetical protein